MLQRYGMVLASSERTEPMLGVAWSEDAID